MGQGGSNRVAGRLSLMAWSRWPSTARRNGRNHKSTSHRCDQSFTGPSRSSVRRSDWTLAPSPSPTKTLGLQSYLLRRYLDPPGTLPTQSHLLRRHDWSPQVMTSSVGDRSDLAPIGQGDAFRWQRLSRQFANFYGVKRKTPVQNKRPT